jgi:sterol desaturase/sphingolipid hydroxylase (fatty acid hydroxylase superfamily)
MARETTAYYAFGVPLYLGLIALEARRAARLGKPSITLGESLGTFSAGLGTIVIGLFLGPALIALYGFGLSRCALVHWPRGAWQPWVLALVLADFGHYWHHRLDHRVAACWAVHGVHHQPERMNFTVAMRHAWFSDLYSFPFYVPLVVAGVPTEHFFVATTLLSFHALVTHTELFDFPSLGILVTPRSHTLHHARNAPYLDRNFGAMFCIWDRLFGTHARFDPACQPEYGTTRGYETHDGVRSQWVLWRDLWELAKQAPDLRARLRLLCGRPGVVPAHAGLSSIEPAPASALLSRGTRCYVVAQFAVTLAFAIGVCIGRELASWPFQLVSCLFVLVSLWTLGGLLDQRRSAWSFERARLSLGGAAVLLAYWLEAP